MNRNATHHTSGNQEACSARVILDKVELNWSQLEKGGGEYQPAKA